MIEDRSETLRRRVNFYRRCLSESIETELARLFLLEIGDAQLELDELESRHAKEKQSAGLRR